MIWILFSRSLADDLLLHKTPALEILRDEFMRQREITYPVAMLKADITGEKTRIRASTPVTGKKDFSIYIWSHLQAPDMKYAVVVDLQLTPALESALRSDLQVWEWDNEPKKVSAFSEYGEIEILVPFWHVDSAGHLRRDTGLFVGDVVDRKLVESVGGRILSVK